jgi:hypothetical protein
VLWPALAGVPAEVPVTTILYVPGWPFVSACAGGVAGEQRHQQKQGWEQGQGIADATEGERNHDRERTHGGRADAATVGAERRGAV